MVFNLGRAKMEEHFLRGPYEPRNSDSQSFPLVKITPKDRATGSIGKRSAKKAEPAKEHEIELSRSPWEEGSKRVTWL